ncbi:hypothetical protein K1718_00060 [Roseibium porphyridii]|uniref:Uncharacterized protein n=1 Tax=Roseibium porphyridii TaxID=2866279 RepID=A0ABY8F356_9HYPH|nr:hypothetical protein [Roseibium sp. KMA01]WFE89791.1 hypothetical protein K1718_00060 [Roseibium sp. KMA01]
MPNGLDDFRKAIEDFRSTFLLAIGGTSIAPIVAHFAGIAPVWPNGVGIITSVATLVVIIFAFQFSKNSSKKIVNRRMLLSLWSCIFCSIVYFGLFSFFVYEIPVTNQKTYLGCGWSERAKLIVSEFGASVDNSCPGQFHEILASASYDPFAVWTVSSINAIALVILVFWIAFFASLSNIVALFVVHQRMQQK